MSLNGILNTAYNALTAFQSEISVTAQNISNADNDDYSVQSAQLSATSTVSSGGNIYGTGVTVSSIVSSVNQTIENALTSELSTQSALEQAQVYMTTIEDLFSEDSEDSLNTLMDAYWAAWEDLSSNPSGETEQNAVYDAGLALTNRLNAIDETLTDLASDLNTQISSDLSEVNSLADQIASLNLSIISAESTGGNANDLEDERNALVDDLGELIDIDITVKEDGSYLITSSGLPLVEDGVSYSLSMEDESIYWNGNTGNTIEITDEISGGAIAGYLTIRDEVVPQVTAQLGELAENLIWTLNYQHSQGSGQDYFSGSLEGTYEAGDSGTLSSLLFGDKIDYTKDFSLMIQDSSGTTSNYQTVDIDMGISTSSISDFLGIGRSSSTYELTVVDEGTLGEQTVVQSSGSLLGGISSGSSSVSDALNAALAEQILTITNGSDTQTFEIADDGSGASRSAADIAEELSEIDGITAYASSTAASFDLSGITNAQDGDVVQFTLYVDGVQEEVSFTVDSSEGTLAEQFEDALETAAQSINETGQDTDLIVNGTSIESASGATIGIEGFEVVDNAGIVLDNFLNFDADDTVSFTLSTSGASSESYDIEVNLTDVDVSDSAAVAKVFSSTIATALGDDTAFTVDYSSSTGELTIYTTDGSSLELSSASGDTGNDASIDITALGTATLTGDGQLDFNGSDLEGATPTASSADYVQFSLEGCESSSLSGVTATIGESGGSYDTAAVLTGSVTIIMDPGMEISSDNTTTAGLFGTSGNTGSGSSMITLGGTDGYENFDDGDTITFEVDGYSISYTVSATSGTLTDAEQAQQLYDALSAVLPTESYEIVKNGCCVTIVKSATDDDEDIDAISITDFTDSTGDDAQLSVSTGTGTGSESPENDTLVSGSDTKNNTSAVTYGNEAVIYWEEYDSSGNTTGNSGYVEVDESGEVEITNDGDTLFSFNISEGTLVAGNTMKVNTNEDGEVDLLDVSVTGTATSVDDTYEFTVVSGGTLPDNEDTIVIEYSCATGTGTIELEGTDYDTSQIIVEVDGMTLTFNSGTLVEGDVFYVTTDDNGQAVSDASGNTVETLSDWHWTLDSFADEFNRSSGGVTATVTEDNTLVLETNDDYCAIENVSYSGANNIDEENVQISVLNYTALTVEASDLEFVRSDDGTWSIANDPTGGTFTIIPEGGDDDGFQVDLDGDGQGDIEITFDQTVTGEGTITMDLENKDTDDLSFAFAGDEDGDSGLAAALGLNTFFTGSSSSDISVNEVVSDGDYLASGILDTETGEIASSDNTNANAMADTRYVEMDMKEWTYTRGEGVTVTVTTTTLDDYQASLVSSVGSTASGIDSSLDYSETLVYQLTQQRDSVSAVSLDEEMINLTAQQQAYLAAAQLLTTVEEMYEALLATS